MAGKFIQYLRGKESKPGEAALLRKIDFFILTFCCLMYFANYVSFDLSLYRCCSSLQINL